MPAPNPIQKTRIDSADVILTHPLAERASSLEITQTEIDDHSDCPVPPESRKVGGPSINVIELVLVLAIVTSLTVIAFIVFPIIKADRQSREEAKILAIAQANSKALFPSNNYAGLNITTANKNDIFPEWMQSRPNSLTNQFDGPVNIFGTDAFDGAGAAVPAGGRAPFIQINYTLVPKEVCLKLAASAANNWGAVYVNGAGATNLIKNTLDGFVFNDTVDKRKIAQACNLSDTATITLISD